MNSESELRLLSRLDHPSLGLGAGCGLPSGGNGFHPASLFANGEQGAWYDPSDLSTMFQDPAGTIPAVVDGAIGLIRDKSGHGNHASQSTAASKPTLRQSGGLYYLEFDGVDDFLSTNAIDFSSTNKATVWLGLRKIIDTTACIVELTANGDVNDGGFYIVPVSVGQVYKISVGGNSGTKNQRSYGPYTAPITQILSASFNSGSGDSVSALSFRSNGVTVGGTNSSSSSDSGSLANAAIYLGRRGGVSLPFNGRIYGMIIRGGASDIVAIGSAEIWMNGKTSAY
ncbi:hypothetical protein O4H52_16125 [Sphingomonadaceae bacterium G21617-S1]|nr:hypothetical protein [Sphingomonadaceae bacterium G21617-S1]